MSVLSEAPVMLVLSWSSHQTRGSVAAVLQSGKMVPAQLELHLYDTKDFVITGRSSQTLDRKKFQHSGECVFL